MNERETLTPDELRARDAVRELPRPAIDPGFRARLRQEFVTGTIESAAPPRVLAFPWHRRAMTRWGAAALAAAAALVVVTTLNQAPEWKLGAVRGEGIVLVDGVPVPTAHTEELARLVRPGAFLQLPREVELEIASAGQMAVQYTGGTQASVPARPGRWFGRKTGAEVREGEVRVMTGAGFRGAKLAIETPEALVMVVGTTFAVICEPTGTCVCVMEGRLRVGTRGGERMAEVEAGRRRYVFSDGRPEESAEMREAEHAPLGDFHQRMQGMMER